MQSITPEQKQKYVTDKKSKIFSEDEIKTVEEVLANWNKTDREESEHTS
ncbi:MAG: hypothetical protein ACRBDL_02190 [Alphaproteobacteria bacterium]